MSSKETLAAAMHNAAQIEDDQDPADKRVMRTTGPSSRSAGVKPRRAKSYTNADPARHTVEDYAVSTFPFPVRTGYAGPIAGPSRGGFAVKSGAATPVLSASTDMSAESTLKRKQSELGKKSPSVQVTETNAGASSSILPPSQVLPLIDGTRKAKPRDVHKLTAELKLLAKSVLSYPFPPPPVSASNLASVLANLTVADDASGQKKPMPAPSPLRIYLSQADLLQKGEEASVRSAMLELMLACLQASMASSGGMKESEKAVYWDEVLRWAREARVDVFDPDGTSRSVLPDEDREHSVSMLRIGTRGGRELTDTPGAIDLLCSFIEETLPRPAPPSPLFDLTMTTPFIRITPPVAPPYSSSLAMLNAFHKFCAPQISIESTHRAIQTVLSIGQSPIERDIGGSGETSVLGFLDTIVKFAEVTGGRVARQSDGGRGNAILHEAVSLMSRVIGCEGLVGVVDIAPGQPVNTLDDEPSPSFLPPIALDLVKTYLRSPAHLALQSLRSNLTAPPSDSSDAPHPPTPVLLLVGSIRALRSTLRDYTADTEAHPDAQGSLEWSWPSALSLGLPFFWTGLQNALAWGNDLVSAQVLQMIDERLEASHSAAIRAREASSGGGSQQGHGSTTHEDVDAGTGITYEEWDYLLEALEKTHKSIVAKRTLLDFAEPMSVSVDHDDAAAFFSDEADLATVYARLVGRLYLAWRSPAFTGSSVRALSLLVSVAEALPTSVSTVVLSHAQATHLCHPPYPGWLERTQAFIETFFDGQTATTTTRLQVLDILAKQYRDLREFDQPRDQLVRQVLLPLLERSFSVTSSAVVAARLANLVVQIGKDDEPVDATDEQNHATSFDIVKSLLVKSAKPSNHVARSPLERSNPSTPRGVQRTLTSGSTVSRTSHNLRDSPSAPRNSSAAPSSSDQPHAVVQSPEGDNDVADIALTAVIGLIELFNACLLRSSRAGAHRAIAVFRSLLGILNSATSGEGSTTSTKSRLAILQWLVRLRADSAHRIYWSRDVDIEDAAAIISRNGSASHPSMQPAEESKAESRGRSLRTTNNERDPRSLSSSRIRLKSEERSPSRGSSAKRVGQAPIMAAPLWSYPETLPFDLGAESKQVGFAGLVSFDHNRMRNWTEDEDPGTGQITFKEVVDDNGPANDMPTLPISEYLGTAIELMQQEASWDLVSLLLCHLPQQLSNKDLVCGPRAAQQLHYLRRLLCAGLSSSERSLLPGVVLPPIIRRTEVHALGYQCLSALIPYSSLFNKSQQDEIVFTFIQGLNDPRTTAKICIHALAMASFAMKPSLTKHLAEIVRQLQKIISSASLGVHILELMAGVGQIPALYANFTENDFQTVFGIACKYIQSHNERLLDNRNENAEDGIEYAFSQYVFLLAYYVIAAWFLAVRLSDRPKYVPFLTRRLVQANEGKPEIDEPTEVCFDMIARYAYTNADPRPRHSRFDKKLIANRGATKAWVIGHSLVTVQALAAPGWVEITVRRPSGVFRMMCEMQNITGVSANSDPNTIAQFLKHRESLLRPPTVPSLIRETLNDFPVLAEKQAHLGRRARSKSVTTSAADLAEGRSRIEDIEVDKALAAAVNEAARPTLESGVLSVDPSAFILQLSTFPDFGSQGPPLLLPEDPATQRGISSLDRLPIVDFHKVGVLYAGPGQTSEVDILRNVSGSQAYTGMVTRLGKLVRLKGSRELDIYAGGLDQENDLDGKWTYYWDDDISQMVFHVATLMPTNVETDPNATLKKRHIGNDFIKIVWNESGRDFAFDTLPGDFNFVNIIIEPHTPAGSPWARPDMSNNMQYFKVSMQCRPGMPEVGPLDSFKMVDAASLPDFVRQISLHSNIFAQVFLASVGFEARSGAQQKIEYVSNWRKRLQQIKLLKARVLEAAERQLPSQPHTLDMEGAETARQFTAWL